ncbi:MAG: hypothetical protein ACRDLS_00865 [Solirubrobacteraceae bacterium]
MPRPTRATTIYFVVAEALTNVVKHDHASAIALERPIDGGQSS